MRRLYFLVPDAQVGKKVVDERLLPHVERKHIRVKGTEPRVPAFP